MIEVRFHPRVRGLSAAFVRRAVSRTLAAERAPKKAVSVFVTTDADIRRLNKKFLKHDYATDVISFGLDDGRVLGDIVVSADFARRWAKKLGLAFREELSRYLVHGTLHLLGWQDDTPRRRARMHERQESILRRFHGR